MAPGLSGSLNEKWRVNVLNMQTKAGHCYWPTCSKLYRCGAYKEIFGHNPTLPLAIVNKQSLGVTPADSTSKFFSDNIFREVQVGDRTELRPNTYNRVLALDLGNA